MKVKHPLTGGEKWLIVIIQGNPVFYTKLSTEKVHKIPLEEGSLFISRYFFVSYLQFILTKGAQPMVYRL